MIDSIFSVVGIDPGLTHPGAAELIRLEHGWNVVSVPLLHSIEELVEWLVTRMRNPPVNLRIVGIEAVTPAVWGQIKKGQSSYEAIKILNCKGAAQVFASFHGVPCVEIMPVTLRKTVVGNGNSSKEQMRETIRRHVRGWPQRCNLNQTDAAAVALAAYRRQIPSALASKMRSRSV